MSEDLYYLYKQCRPRWNAALCCISSGSPLFAKVLWDFHKYKGLMAFTSFSGSQEHNNYWIICIAFVLPAYIDHTDFLIFAVFLTLIIRVVLTLWNRFKSSSKIFLLAVPRRYFFCESFVFLCFSCFWVSSLLLCGHMLGKGWPLGSC